eukprot:Sspe_Gene.104506::Locus_80883_Transcript_1_1_Confidence_1.000_Length_322::g.104506::m.104506
MRPGVLSGALLRTPHPLRTAVVPFHTGAIQTTIRDHPPPFDPSRGGTPFVPFRLSAGGGWGSTPTPFVSTLKGLYVPRDEKHPKGKEKRQKELRQLPRLSCAATAPS